MRNVPFMVIVVFFITLFCLNGCGNSENVEAQDRKPLMDDHPEFRWIAGDCPHSDLEKVGYLRTGDENMPMVHPEAIATAGGKLYVIDSGINNILVFDSNNRFLDKLFQDGEIEDEQFVINLSVDEDGNLLLLRFKNFYIGSDKGLTRIRNEYDFQNGVLAGGRIYMLSISDSLPQKDKLIKELSLSGEYRRSLGKRFLADDFPDWIQLRGAMACWKNELFIVSTEYPTVAVISLPTGQQRSINVKVPALVKRGEYNCEAWRKDRRGVERFRGIVAVRDIEVADGNVYIMSQNHPEIIIAKINPDGTVARMYTHEEPDMTVLLEFAILKKGNSLVFYVLYARERDEKVVIYKAAG